MKQNIHNVKGYFYINWNGVIIKRILFYFKPFQYFIIFIYVVTVKIESDGLNRVNQNVVTGASHFHFYKSQSSTCV